MYWLITEMIAYMLKSVYMKSFKITLGIILGFLFVLIGYIYATHTAQNLPHYFIGYQAGLDKVHTKHSIASFVVAALCFVYAWFQTGPKAQSV